MCCAGAEPSRGGESKAGRSGSEDGDFTARSGRVRREHGTEGGGGGLGLLLTPDESLSLCVCRVPRSRELASLLQRSDVKKEEVVVVVVGVGTRRFRIRLRLGAAGRGDGRKRP